LGMAKKRIEKSRLRAIFDLLKGARLVGNRGSRGLVYWPVYKDGEWGAKPYAPRTIAWLLAEGVLESDGETYWAHHAGYAVLRSMTGQRAYTVAAQLERAEPDLNSGCWLWPGSVNEHGYGMIRLNRTLTKAHRFFYEHLVGPIEAGMDLCHRCDTPACVNPAHMFVGARLDNMRDCQKKKRIAVGSKLPQAKLTEAAVIEIRRGGKSDAAFGRQFGVSSPTILSARRRHSWNHIP
jgi:HNH endonuclease